MLTFWGIQCKDRSTPSTRKRSNKPENFTISAPKFPKKFSFLVYNLKNNQSIKKNVSNKIPSTPTFQTF